MRVFSQQIEPFGNPGNNPLGCRERGAQLGQADDNVLKVIIGFRRAAVSY